MDRECDMEGSSFIVEFVERVRNDQSIYSSREGRERERVSEATYR